MTNTLTPSGVFDPIVKRFKTAIFVFFRGNCLLILNFHYPLLKDSYGHDTDSHFV